MLPALAVTLLLAADDRPLHVELMPRPAAVAAERAFVADEHPVIATVAVSAAVITALTVVLVLVLAAQPVQIQKSPPPQP